MALKYKCANSTYDLSGPEYTTVSDKHKRLNYVCGNTVKQVGLTTDTSASEYSPLRFNLDGQNYYVGRTTSQSTSSGSTYDTTSRDTSYWDRSYYTTSTNYTSTYGGTSTDEREEFTSVSQEVSSQSTIYTSHYSYTASSTRASTSKTAYAYGADVSYTVGVTARKSTSTSSYLTRVESTLSTTRVTTSRFYGTYYGTSSTWTYSASVISYYSQYRTDTKTYTSIGAVNTTKVAGQKSGTSKETITTKTGYKTKTVKVTVNGKTSKQTQTTATTYGTKTSKYSWYSDITSQTTTNGQVTAQSTSTNPSYYTRYTRSQYTTYSNRKSGTTRYAGGHGYTADDHSSYSVSGTLASGVHNEDIYITSSTSQSGNGYDGYGLNLYNRVSDNDADYYYLSTNTSSYITKTYGTTYYSGYYNSTTTSTFRSQHTTSGNLASATNMLYSSARSAASSLATKWAQEEGYSYSTYTMCTSSQLSSTSFANFYLTRTSGYAYETGTTESTADATWRDWVTATSLSSTRTYTVSSSIIYTYRTRYTATRSGMSYATNYNMTSTETTIASSSTRTTSQLTTLTYSTSSSSSRSTSSHNFV